ncbi:hypothetical protein [Corynebacterium massiliense]|uniref:Cell division protein n=1 Tax=Corynebacterium massiliense DSM 45435 TaxID=1121364 RepID=A0ABY7UAB9_9CORY|nr:hypothetical protein [Corynebacterium massiliense]WCZ32894.1 hypothetical protein CMASS_07300 [Corynebacterium massiliense DSM 45435]
MGQEQFAGPDYFTEFDPEKFLRDMRAAAQSDSDNAADADDSEHSGGDDVD